MPGAKHATGQYEKRVAITFTNLAKLRSKINPGDAKAIYLPPSPDMPTPPVGTHFFVSGWGRLSKSGSGCYPKTLNAVSLPHISLKDCEKAYATDNWPVTERMICTSFPGGGRDTCSGDSGGMKIISLLLEIEHVTSTYFTGPLVWLDSDTKQILQIGIVSWGDIDPANPLLAST